VPLSTSHQAFRNGWFSVTEGLISDKSREMPWNDTSPSQLNFKYHYITNKLIFTQSHTFFGLTRISIFHTNCCVFSISKIRGESDLGLYTTLGLAKTFPLCGGAFRQILWSNTSWIGSCHLAAALILQFPNLYTDLDPTLLYILILIVYSKLAR